jgi:phage terminase small subunit
MRLVEIDQMDVIDILNDDGSLKPIREWPKIWRTTLSGFDLSSTIMNINTGVCRVNADYHRSMRT